MKEQMSQRGQKEWTHNIPYDLAREYNTMVLVRNKQRSGINRRPKRDHQVKEQHDE